MLKQISAVRADPPAARWSAGFVARWRVQVLGLPAGPPRQYLAPGVPGDAEVWRSFQAERRVNAMIPCLGRRSDGSAWGHASIGWGPSPSGHAIRRGTERNARDPESRTRHGRPRKAPKPPMTAEEVTLHRIAAAVRDDNGIVAPDNGLLTYEAPSSQHPRGRAFIAAVARQHPQRFKGAWGRLSARQQRIALAYYGEIGGTMKEVADRHGVSAPSVCNMLLRVNRVMSDAGLPELMQCRPHAAPTVSYSAHPLAGPI